MPTQAEVPPPTTAVVIANVRRFIQRLTFSEAVRTGLVSCLVNWMCHIICSFIRATVFATMSKLPMPEHGRAQHGRVFLFSGHMIDAPDRARPRFPEAAVTAARSAIEQVLDALQAGEHDAAICGGACGGDLLFAGACLSRGMSLQLVLAVDEPWFLDASVSFAGAQWTALYFDVRQHPRTTTITPNQFDPLENDESAFERANRWQVCTAMAAPSVQFICLWDGEVGDGPGGTAHMIRKMQRRGAPVHWIRTGALWQAEQNTHYHERGRRCTCAETNP